MTPSTPPINPADYELAIHGKTLCARCGLDYLAGLDDGAQVSVIGPDAQDGTETCDQCGVRIVGQTEAADLRGMRNAIGPASYEWAWEQG